MPQKGTEKRRSSEKVISTDKAALLWMYCKELAPFEPPTFSKNVGELIARATRAPQKAAVRAPKRATDKLKRNPQAVKTGAVPSRRVATPSSEEANRIELKRRGLRVR